MGNRSRFVAVSAAAASAAVVARHRRARLRRAAEQIREAIMPTHVVDPHTESAPEADEIHAPGHQHRVSPGEEGWGPSRVRSRHSRPWTKNAHGMGRPLSGN